jgi:hypothetical protein
MIFLFPTLFLIFKPFQSNFLPPTYSPALIYFGRERAWWITCNYPTVLKEKNRNRKSTTCVICWLKSILQEEKRREYNQRHKQNHNVGRTPTLWLSCSRRFSSCSTDFSQQIALSVSVFLFQNCRIITSNPPTSFPPKINKSWGVCGWQKNWIGKG